MISRTYKLGKRQRRNPLRTDPRWLGSTVASPLSPEVPPREPVSPVPRDPPTQSPEPPAPRHPPPSTDPISPVDPPVPQQPPEGPRAH